jgi:N-hydroxyarylamine O-acetyltransferase
MTDAAAFNLEAYLARIGGARALAPSLEALRALHQAHVGAIPFENLDILLGRTIRVDLASVEAKLVAARRGGYCFEQNTLFRAALEALGYAVTALSALRPAYGVRPARALARPAQQKHRLNTHYDRNQTRR